MIPILIPTLGRDRIITLEFLTQEMHRHVTLLCPAEQHAGLSKAYPSVRVTVCPRKGISHVRQWVLDNYSKQQVLMSDDDLPFYVRKDRDNWSDWHARRATPEEVTEALEKMAALTMLYPMVGMSGKQGNNNHKSPIVHATRMWNIWTIDCEIANAEGFRFDATDTMQDFIMHLNFLTAGYTTAMIADFMHCQYASNQAGGCSTYRSIETQKRSTAYLKNRWPNFVRVVQKSVVKDGSWFGSDQPRPDVQIAWKKALEYGRKIRNSQLL